MICKPKKIVSLLAFIFISVTASLLHALAPNELIYTFTVIPNQPNSLFASVTFKSTDSGESIILLPDQYAGKEKLYENIIIHKTNSKHKALVFDGYKPYKKLITHVAGEDITLIYEIKSNPSPSIKAATKNYYLPIVQPNYFYILGMNSLILPDKNLNTIYDVKIKWDIPEGWTLANSFGAKAKEQAFQASGYQLLKGVYLAGDFQLVEESHDNQTIWTALRGEFDNISVDELSEKSNKIIRAMRKTWQKENEQASYYLVTAIPIENKTDYQDSAMFTQGLSLYLSKNSQEPDYQISHKYYHHWNKLKKERNQYWFTEGFRDYFANKFLAQTKIMSYPDYIKANNKLLEQYYLSPVNTLPNELIVNNYDNNPDAKKMAYLRGHMLALNWNAQIKLNSNGKKSLDDLMKTIFDSDKTVLTTDDIITFSKQYIPNGIVEEEVGIYIDKGVLIKPDRLALGPCANPIVKQIDNKEITQFELNTVMFRTQPRLCQGWFD